MRYSQASPAAKSAIKASLVSPERCEAMSVRPAVRAVRAASKASLTVPTWLGLRMTARMALVRAASAMRGACVTVRSSPTISASVFFCSAAKAAGSSSANGSSIESRR